MQSIKQYDASYDGMQKRNAVEREREKSTTYMYGLELQIKVVFLPDRPPLTGSLV